MSEVYKAPEAQLHDEVKSGEYGSVDAALSGHYQFSPMETINEAWSLVGGFKGVYWLAFLAYLIVAMSLGALTGFFVPAADPANPLAVGPLVGNIASQLLSMIITLPLGAGLFIIALKRTVRVKPEVGEMFNHFDKILPLFITSLVMYIFIIIGLVLFVLPVIYLAIAFSFALPLVFEKGMSPMEALSTSRKAITHRWFAFVGLLILLMVILFASALVFGIGLIWTVPLMGLSFAIVYRNMFGVESSTLTEG